LKKINDNPIRYAGGKTLTKKGLFGKKELTKFAVCNEKEDPISAFDYDSIDQFVDGIATAKIKKHIHYIDLDGKQILKTYTDGAYNVTRMGDYFKIVQAGSTNKGLAYRDGTILLELKGNCLEIQDDIVIYGDLSPVGFEYRKLGAGKIAEGRFISVLPCNYNYVQYLGSRMVAAGRYAVTKTSTPSSLTKNRVSVTATPAFQIYSVDTGKLSDLVFGEIHLTDHGNYSAVIYPRVKPDELTYREQTFSEAFHGTGLLDLSVKKHIVLNRRLEFPK